VDFVHGLAVAACLVAAVTVGCTKPAPPAGKAADDPGKVGAVPPGGTTVAAADPAPAPAAEPAPAPDGRLRDISFDDVKLPLEKGDPFTPEVLPASVRALERQRVRIRGYILPSFQQRGITQFVLVRDNMECCFGPGALLHDCVVVRMLPGRSTDFSIRPVAVSGTFRIDELKGPDGKHLAVYAIDGEEVR
jgi:hypothetical protein